MSGTTERDAQALAYLAERLREETHGAGPWDEAGIWAVIKPLVGRNLAITIEQVTRHAADPEAKTPGAITRPFLPERQGPQPQRPPRRDQECPHHAGQWAGNCGGCAVDRANGDPAPSKRTTRTGPPPEWRKAREGMKKGSGDAT